MQYSLPYYSTLYFNKDSDSNDSYGSLSGSSNVSVSGSSVTNNNYTVNDNIKSLIGESNTLVSDLNETQLLAFNNVVVSLRSLNTLEVKTQNEIIKLIKDNFKGDSHPGTVKSTFQGWIKEKEGSSCSIDEDHKNCKYMILVYDGKELKKINDKTSETAYVHFNCSTRKMKRSAIEAIKKVGVKSIIIVSVDKSTGIFEEDEPIPVDKVEVDEVDKNNNGWAVLCFIIFIIFIILIVLFVRYLNKSNVSNTPRFNTSTLFN